MEVRLLKENFKTKMLFGRAGTKVRFPKFPEQSATRPLHRHISGHEDGDVLVKEWKRLRGVSTQSVCCARERENVCCAGELVICTTQSLNAIKNSSPCDDVIILLDDWQTAIKPKTYSVNESFADYSSSTLLSSESFYLYMANVWTVNKYVHSHI